MQADAVSQIAADLYALPPGQFTVARDQRARQAKADGQPDVAAAVRKLARPTVSAWLVNQLVRAEPDAMGRLLALAEALQDAQRELAGDRLRELSAQRRQVVAELMSAASATAAAAGQQLSQATVAEVRTTLEAAIADPGAGAEVRSGQLTRALAYAGLGEVDLTTALARPPGTGHRPGRAASQAGSPAGHGAASQEATSGRPAGKRADASGTAARAAASALAVETARADAEAAAAAAGQAEHVVTRLGEQRRFLRRRIEQLRAEVREADAEDAALARAEAKARRTQDTAARALTAARKRLEQAQARAGAAGA